jgi:hypothetical protein
MAREMRGFCVRTKARRQKGKQVQATTDDDDFLIPFALYVLGLWDYNLVSIRRFGAWER